MSDCSGYFIPDKKTGTYKLIAVDPEFQKNLMKGKAEFIFNDGTEHHFSLRKDRSFNKKSMDLIEILAVELPTENMLWKLKFSCKGLLSQSELSAILENHQGNINEAARQALMKTLEKEEKYDPEAICQILIQLAKPLFSDKPVVRKRVIQDLESTLKTA